MSLLTVFVKMANKETHEVDLEGHDTVKDLYRKAGEAAGLEVGTKGSFFLHFEGTVLDDAYGTEEIQQLGMWQGCELFLCCKEGEMRVAVNDLCTKTTRDVMAKRLEEDPNLLLEIDASGITFLKISAKNIPAGLKHLRVADPLNDVQAIGDGFLKNCESLVTLDVSSLLGVLTVGKYFLYGCTSLKATDLTPCKNMKMVDFGFLSCCSSLETIDLSPLRNVKSVDSCFLSSCTSLRSVNLAPLRWVEYVGEGFLSKCESLKVIDTSPLRNLKSLSHHFLSNNTSLTSANLSQLSQVSSVGDYFLSDCSSLASLDLRSFQNIKLIGAAFLAGCSSLTAVDISHMKGTVASVGPGFMEGCDGIPVKKRKLKEGGCIVC
eukprot:TRINITY_DN3128_c0_g1_i3.p1 TRINITY_DN3128_c0_g1~~TRINITY_DN3128_c0_g1_i3.p1  ORF type:complete len:377 (+),score=81.71 TRINITY_DN3128_c0_g1_i3:32-1162(+)